MVNNFHCAKETEQNLIKTLKKKDQLRKLLACCPFTFNEYYHFFMVWFFNKMRNYSNILFDLTGKKTKNKNKINKYQEVSNFINETKFIKHFLGKNEFDSLSYVAHNFNNYEFQDKLEIVTKYEEKFRDILKTTNTSIVIKEFLNVIELFKKIENIKYEEDSLILVDKSMIINFLDELIDYISKEQDIVEKLQNIKN